MEIFPDNESQKEWPFLRKSEDGRFKKEWNKNSFRKITVFEENREWDRKSLQLDQALSLWSGSTDSKSLDYRRTNPAAAAARSLQLCPTLCDPRWQPTRLPHPWDYPGKTTGVGCHCLLRRTNPKEYQIWELTQKKPLEYKTQHHPTTSSTLCMTPHLKNKQNKNTKPASAGRSTTSLSLAH